MSDVYTIPIDRPRLREAFKDMACCDAAHLAPDSTTRQDCEVPKQIVLSDDGRYAIVHATKFSKPNWSTYHMSDEKSQAMLRNWKSHRSPLPISGPLVTEEDDVTNLEQKSQWRSELESKLNKPTTPTNSPTNGNDRAMVSPTDGKRRFVRAGVEPVGQEPWELVDGERFELLDKEEIDEEYWEQGGYSEEPPEQWMKQNKLSRRPW